MMDFTAGVFACSAVQRIDIVLLQNAAFLGWSASIDWKY
ncbi:hypothetical protein SAMN05216352_102130 [Alteribacillus bidgolensis]|uniref:Uncharacterized protein n=1 Tax=Alteribacillus bidgolensis TaxID=930129 RepID=A0A1G8E9M2_9BACI|nr:hypothetical protein SAMN05216352_102130 [Alteribacillus bidgolensis]